MRNGAPTGAPGSIAARQGDEVTLPIDPGANATLGVARLIVAPS